MRHLATATRAALASAALLAGSSALFAAEASPDDIAALREQIRLLDQKLKVLERKQEIKDDDVATAAKSAPKITISDKGFTLASGDGAILKNGENALVTRIQIYF
jgi:phosphate-selective porin OprO/OprP